MDNTEKSVTLDRQDTERRQQNTTQDTNNMSNTDLTKTTVGGSRCSHRVSISCLLLDTHHNPRIIIGHHYAQQITFCTCKFK